MKIWTETPKTKIDNALMPFVAARERGRLAFLVGAGVSWDAPACRPMAGEISSAIGSALWSIGTIAKNRWKESTIQSFAKAVRFETLMQLLAETTGSLGFLRALKGGKPNQLHRILSKALRSRCPVLTTNFDELIERAFPAGQRPETLTRTADFKRWSKRTPRGVLAKLHGSLGDLDSMCATMRAIGTLGPAFMWDPPRGEYLARVRRDFPMAVLGYSGTDDLDILPRLRITESNQPLLWVLHARGRIRIATDRDIVRLATAPGLPEMLHKSNAAVIVGNTLLVVATLCGFRPKEVAGHRGHPLATRLLHSMRRTTAPYLADFLIGRILYEGGRRKVSYSQFAAIRRQVGERHPGLAARCLTNEATVATDIGKWAIARRKLEAVLPEMQRYADERAFVNACLNLALVYRRLGKTDEAEAHFRMLIRTLKTALELHLERARAQVNLADMLFEQEQFDKAIRLVKAARIGFKKAGDYGGMATVFGVLGKILFARQEVKNAMEVLSIALWHARVAWNRSDEARILNNIGTMQRVAGMFDAASASFAQARLIGEAIADPEPVIVSEMGALTVDLAAGRLNSAIRRAKACLSPAESIGLHYLAMQTRGNLSLALMDSGYHAKAVHHLEKIYPFLVKHGPRYQAAFTQRNIGECLASMGQHKRARELIEKAAQMYEELNMTDEAKETRAMIYRVVSPSQRNRES
ncbi:MAG: tetratricopeptide repeat protein [Desulfobacterales bacterium]|nr:tetratricopeptide repeat protein [Desulfobacterales bacterium]